MYQPIAEPVAVIGIYHHGQFTPKKFRWRSRVLPVDQITLVSDVTDGNIKKRLYSLVSGQEVYRVEFNRQTEEWMLAELWVE